jgi:hypothetical protein
MSTMPPESVEIACPRCKVRIAVPATSAGTSRQCPTCRTDFLITQRMVGLSSIKTAARIDEDDLWIDDSPSPLDDEEYAVESPPPPPPPSTSEEASDEEDEEEAEVTAASWSPTASPPLGLFAGGLSDFFGNGEIWRRTIPLSVGVFFTVWLLAFGLFLGRVPNLGFAAFGAWFGCLVLCCFGAMIGVMTTMTGAAFAVAVVRDISDGLATVESWPPGYLVDWALEMCYIGAAMLWSFAPGGMVAMFLPEVPRIIVYGVSEALFFPIVLLAALDGVTPGMPSSIAVWKSPFRHPFVWLLFYILSIPLLVLTGGICLAAIGTAYFLLCILAAIVFAPAWMLYFRLLGRLAWYCSGRYEQMLMNEQ